MPREHLSMRKIREILRLKWESKLGDRPVANSCGVSRSTVSDYVRRARAAGLSWPLPEDLDEDALSALLFPPTPSTTSRPPLPNWAEVHRELKRKGVTRWLLWSEYKERYPDGIQYSQFCQRYRKWLATQSAVMRQDHKAGEKLFVDYAGMTMEVIDPRTGEVRKASIFVATLGASNYTYAEATLSQTLPDWLGSHVRALTFLGGSPEVVVPDNLKTGITHACFYEPDLNPSYWDLARHYRLAVIPARVKRPRDKAKVEVHVQIVEREILAPLRHRTFFGLDELNALLSDGVERLNRRSLQKQKTSRRQLFEQIDQPALRPLPNEPYRFAEWKRAKVHLDYHIELTGHYYSVPHVLIGQTVEIRFNPHTVEIFRKAKRVASHRRSFQRGAHTTVTEHMPKAHQRAGNLTPKRLIDWAQDIGPDTQAWVQVVLKRRPHPEQGFRTCLGALKLAKRYGNERLNAACKRALRVNAFSYRSLDSMLKHQLDQQPLPEEKQITIALPKHANVRGPDYFH
jgi:transposase